MCVSAYYYIYAICAVMCLHTVLHWGWLAVYICYIRMSACCYICVLILLLSMYAVCVCVLLYVSSYYLMHADARPSRRRLQNDCLCPHTTVYVLISSYTQTTIFVRMLSPLRPIVSAYHYICVLILLYITGYTQTRGIAGLGLGPANVRSEGEL